MAQRRQAAAKDAKDTATASGDETRSLPPNTVTLVNPGTSGVVYDVEGHSLGGGERVTVPYPLDRVGQKAVNRGYLLVDTWTPGAEAPKAEKPTTEDAPAEEESETEGVGGESDQSPSDQVG
jgi:hypothetical protein